MRIIIEKLSYMHVESCDVIGFPSIDAVEYGYNWHQSLLPVTASAGVPLVPEGILSLIK